MNQRRPYSGSTKSNSSHKGGGISQKFPKDQLSRTYLPSLVTVSKVAIGGIVVYSALNWASNLVGTRVPNVEEGINRGFHTIIDEYQIPAHPSRHFDPFLRSSDIQKETPAQRFSSRSLFDALKAAISEYQYSRKALDDTSFVSEYHTGKLSSNQPMEDRNIEYVISEQPSGKSEKNPTYFFGVYDGHSGWHCAQSVRDFLGIYVYRNVRDALKEDFSLSKFSSAFQNAFLELDTELISAGFNADLKNFKELIMSGTSGAVAALAMIHKNNLVVGGCGDVQSVVGRWDREKSSYQTITLTNEHHVNLPSERERLLTEHPGEQFVIYAGRVLGGLQPSRAFGDGRYKWSVSQMQKLSEILSFSEPSDGKKPKITPPMHYFSPPYVTAKPDVKSLELSSDDHFMIMATDGLWDCMTNEEAVRHVQDYIKKRKNSPLDDEIHKYNAGSYLILKAAEHLPNGPAMDENGNPISPKQVAVQLLSIPPRLSRRYRDDITATVVFFKGMKDQLPPSNADSITSLTWSEALARKWSAVTQSAVKHSSKL